MGQGRQRKQKLCSRCGRYITTSNTYARGGKRKDRQSYCKGCSNVKANEWHNANPEKSRYWCDTGRLRRLGITVEDREKLRTAQNGRCAICERQTKDLCLDHCHKTGVVRGLLCRYCNHRVLGVVRDDADLLLKAYKYLQSPPAYAILGDSKHETS